MFAKFEITGKIELLTGMHIGGSSAFAAIGAVDSPVVRDTLSNEPMLPGSSLKGKLRALLAQQYNDGRCHKTHDEDDARILRLFGSAKKEGLTRSRLIFRDLFLSNMEELKADGLHSATEVKFENTINRLTSIANPRQIERAIRGCQFDLSIIYDPHGAQSAEEMLEDLELLAEGIQLLQYDYLGGHGSRGYGKVKLSNIGIRPVVGEVDPQTLALFQSAFQGV